MRGLFNRLISLFCLLWLVGASQLVSAEEAKVSYAAPTATATIGVMEFLGGSGVSQEEADILAEMMMSEIDDMGDVHVIGKSDILSLMNLEKQRRLAGCDTKECISEIGGALGVRWMVSGKVGLFGESYVLILKLFDTERTQVISRVSRRIKGDADKLLTELPGAVHELVARVGERIGLPMPGTVSIASRPHKVPWKPWEEIV